MKNKKLIYSSVFMAIVLSITCIAKYEINHKSNVSLSSQQLSATSLDEEKTLSHKYIAAQQLDNLMLANSASGTPNNTAAATTAGAGNATAPKYIASRGGSVTVKPASSSSSVELLDWWKSARYVFPVNSIAQVTDVYTGKTFNIMRTMGDNHADCEALTANDTAIIKSIWGGFSWDRRPVIVNVGGRRLAASMSGMPHAGLDSAPAFQVVNNRSEGYGTGDNLDVIKGNGMDGHFDVHFLNSTRHKDGEIDPQHQACIKIAAAQK